MPADAGGSSIVINGGMARHCERCGVDHFPRTDAAVIVAVLDAEDRLLLGGKPEWGNRVSVLAGFVEAGESLEQAIHREIGEEVDISLSDLHYFGSQPWPFPALAHGGVLRSSDRDRHQRRYSRDRARRVVHPRRAQRRSSMPASSDCRARALSRPG